MPDFITTSFYPRIDDDISDVERLKVFLTRLSEQGHHLAGSDRNARILVREETHAQAQSINSQSLLLPTVTPTLWKDVEAFAQQRSIDELFISVRSTPKGDPFYLFKCSLTFFAQDSQIDVTMVDDTDEVEDLLHYLDILQLVYSIWHPLYGYQDDPTGDVPSLEEIRHLNITWLYNINLFGPELVEHLGRERVLSTPAWLLKTLDDDGVLLVPMRMSGGGSDEEYATTRDRAAEHLSLISELPEEEE